MKDLGRALLLAGACGLALSCAPHDPGATVVTRVETEAVLSFAVSAVAAYEKERGSLHRLLQDGDARAREYVEVLGRLRDEWNTPIRFTHAPDAWEVRSAGPDRVFDTGDDRTRRGACSNRALIVS